MKAPQSSKSSTSKLSASSEYALILGSGVTAVVSLAAQQVAAASLPVTALVAIGLLNRRRLDQRLKDNEPVGPVQEENSTQEISTATKQVTAQPMPEFVSAQPSPSASVPNPIARFSRRRGQSRESLADLQQASLRKIGAHLKQVRQEKLLSLWDIHERTFIQVYMLKAIEAGEMGSLPEPFYIRAFVQKYALAVGLKGREIAAEFPMG